MLTDLMMGRIIVVEESGTEKRVRYCELETVSQDKFSFDDDILDDL